LAEILGVYPSAKPKDLAKKLVNLLFRKGSMNFPARSFDVGEVPPWLRIKQQ